MLVILDDSNILCKVKVWSEKVARNLPFLYICNLSAIQPYDCNVYWLKLSSYLSLSIEKETNASVE